MYNFENFSVSPAKEFTIGKKNSKSKIIFSTKILKLWNHCNTYWITFIFNQLFSNFHIHILLFCYLDFWLAWCSSPMWRIGQISCSIFVFCPHMSQETFFGDANFGAKLTFVVRIPLSEVTLDAKQSISSCSSALFWNISGLLCQK